MPFDEQIAHVLPWQLAQLLQATTVPSPRCEKERVMEREYGEEKEKNE